MNTAIRPPRPRNPGYVLGPMQFAWDKATERGITNGCWTANSAGPLERPQDPPGKRASRRPSFENVMLNRSVVDENVRVVRLARARKDDLKKDLWLGGVVIFKIAD